MTTFPWIEFFILFGAGVVGIACVMPYALELMHEMFDKALQRLRKPKWVLIALQMIQSVILIGFAAGFGLLLAPHAGLGVPLLSGLLAGKNVTSQTVAMLAPAIGLGIITATLMLLLEIVVFWPRLPKRMREIAPIPALWKRLLASLYGAIDEEILLRLFALTLLAWLLAFVWHMPGGYPSIGALWTANIIAAIAFGLGHLPATAALAKITPLLIGRAILLNGVVGIAAGYLYWRYGLEAAMLAHFSADIVLHGVGDSIAQSIRAKTVNSPVI